MRFIWILQIQLLQFNVPHKKKKEYWSINWNTKQVIYTRSLSINNTQSLSLHKLKHKNLNLKLKFSNNQFPHKCFEYVESSILMSPMDID